MTRGVVPPGAPGNPTAGAFPIHGTCGHRYQEGQATATPICHCGMFSVGLCARCGAPRCGVHGTLGASGFLCEQHAEAALAASIAAQEAADRQRRLEEEAGQARASAQLRELEEARRRGAPGFPEEAASGATLSAVLHELVPSHLQDYVVGFRAGRLKVNYRAIGPAVRIRGWGFELRKHSFESNFAAGCHGLGIIVASDGAWYTAKDLNVQARWTLSREVRRDQAWLRVKQAPDSLVPRADVFRIRAQVLVWRGLDI